MKRKDFLSFSIVLALISLLVGLLIRLFWVQDMPFEMDQKWTMQRVMNWGVSEPFPWIGMRSSVGVPNPGLSVWGFIGLGALFGSHPIGVATGVIFLNFFSLLILFIYAFKKTKGLEQNLWMWLISFNCVNPFSFHFNRNIWAQSLLPFLGTLVLLSWLHRSKKSASFLLGLAGFSMGQIHLGGFFTFISLIFCTLVWDGMTQNKKINKKGLLLGVGVSSLGLIPWVLFKIQNPSQSAAKVISSEIWYKIKTLTIPRIWIEDSLGVSIHYTLGHHFTNFLKLPLWNNNPTSFVYAAHVFIWALFIVLIFIFSIYFFKSVKKVNWKNLEIQHPFATVFLLFFISGCMAMTFGPFLFYRHYLLNLYPILFGFLPILIVYPVRSWSKAVGSLLWALQLFITLQFIHFIHVNGGAEKADYSVSYSKQMKLKQENLDKKDNGLD